ncbi:MAG: DNA alkylation repair protein [Oscillospiraceae bacterium]
MTKIQLELHEMRDEKYAEFQSRLTPNLPREYFIGVRTPLLRRYAKQLAAEGCGDFLAQLPHEYFEENQLHAFVLSAIKDYDECLEAVEEFLPYVNNWATCDQLSPKVFGKYPERLICAVRRWCASDLTYTVRFGVDMLMAHFLDGSFTEECPRLVAEISSEEYYVNMARAWYFATALAKQYDAALPFLTENRLDEWTHNKTIRKAIESYRIDDEKKAFLRTLQRKQ